MNVLLFLSLGRVDSLIVKSETESLGQAQSPKSFSTHAKFVETAVHREEDQTIHLSIDTTLSHHGAHRLANWVAMGVDAGVSIAVIEAAHVVGRHWEYQSCW
jgi:hypothetical protein